MRDTLLINMVPGKTVLHKLTGASKVRLFVVLLLYIIMSFDARLIVPLLAIGIVALVSLRPQWKIVRVFMVVVFFMNLLNIVLFWVADPSVGESWTGGSRTILATVTPRLYISLETVWYLSVRLVKMYTSFLVSMVFILSVVPSELASGLHSLKVPYKICTVFSLAFRYIPDIGRDYRNIKISLQARGVEMDDRRIPLRTRLKHSVLILVPLVITSFDRIGTIANAMDLRGYGRLRDRTYFCEREPALPDKICGAGIIILLVFCLYWIVAKNLMVPGRNMWFPFSV